MTQLGIRFLTCGIRAIVAEKAQWMLLKCLHSPPPNRVNITQYHIPKRMAILSIVIKI